jgi:hypothetical protein
MPDISWVTSCVTAKMDPRRSETDTGSWNLELPELVSLLKQNHVVVSRPITLHVAAVSLYDSPVSRQRTKPM